MICEQKFEQKLFLLHFQFLTIFSVAGFNNIEILNSTHPKSLLNYFLDMAIQFKQYLISFLGLFSEKYVIKVIIGPNLNMLFAYFFGHSCPKATKFEIK